MKMFSVILPERDNQGHNMGTAHAAFQGRLLNLFGGFTKHNVEGAWIDKKSASPEVFNDRSIEYRFAGALVSREELQELASVAHRLFPDQRSIFFAKTGNAEIVHVDDINSYPPFWRLLNYA